MLSFSGLMIPHGMEVPSNSHCSFLKIIQTNHQLFGLFHGCSILTFTLMAVYAWTSSKTSGVLYMMSLLFLPPFSHYSVILIRILLRIPKLHECSVKANVSTTEESARLWNKAGLLTSNNMLYVGVVFKKTIEPPLLCLFPLVLSLSLSCLPCVFQTL